MDLQKSDSYLHCGTDGWIDIRDLDRVIILLLFENFMCGMFVTIKNEYYLIFVIKEKGGLNSLSKCFNANDHKESFGASLNEDIFDPVELRDFFQILSNPALLPSSKDSLVVLTLSGLQGLLILHCFILECVPTPYLSVNFLLILQPQRLSIICSAFSTDIGASISLHCHL